MPELPPEVALRAVTIGVGLLANDVSVVQLVADTRISRYSGPQSRRV